MEAKRKVPFYLLAAGAFVMSIPFILKHYVPIGDVFDGIVRGLGVGLMIFALFYSAKQRRHAGRFEC